MNAKDTILTQLAPVEAMLEKYGCNARMFRQCFLNTLETTLSREQDGTVFVITGDIPAMWLRDSTAQVMHYVRFADDPEIASIIRGLIRRQMDYIILDPYANAFNKAPNGAKWSQDRPVQSPWVWERKYEIDSLCHPVQLSFAYYLKTADRTLFTDSFHKALSRIVEVFRTEQNHETSSYYFERDNCPPSDTLPHEGRGEPVAYTGMTWSGFRPSDDACRYGYLIPANLFACVTLERIAFFAREMGDNALEMRAVNLLEEIREGLRRHSTVDHPEFGCIYAYETDGMGHYHLMDDANVPSLLSLPYLGVCGKEDPLYISTRSFVLSRENPYYYEGSFARGVGSPHTPDGYIWPIALCIQALTAVQEQEIAQCLRLLFSTHAGTGFMHESFDPEDPARFTREWFAWANSLLGELIFSLYEQGRLEKILALV